MDLSLKFEVLFALYGVLEFLGALVFALRFRLTPTGILGTAAFSFLALTRILRIAFGVDMNIFIVPSSIANAIIVVAILIAPIRSINERKIEA